MRSYTYKALRPFKVELVISKTADVKSAIDFFTSTERISKESCINDHSWYQYAIESLGPKADARELEAYVAYYVKAISACGVYTCRSCDGDHPNGGLIYVDSEYPSCIWHQCIWNKIIQPRFGAVPYIGNSIRLTHKNQEVIYNTVYHIADFLYQNRSQILHLKKQTLENINSHFIKHHSLEEIEAFYTEECERVMHLNERSI